MLSKDVAICIRVVDYSETSQIATFFGRNRGKIRAIAKGSKRAKSSFDGAIEVFSHGRIVFIDPGRAKLSTLTEFEQAPSFAGLRGSFFSLNCCLLGSELLDGLTDDFDAHRQLFDDFKFFLECCGKAKERREVLGFLILFELGLLKEVGLRPVFEVCANCRRAHGLEAGPIHFSSAANGLICRDCAGGFPERIEVGREAGVCLLRIRTIGEASEGTLLAVEEVLVYHFSELLHRRPKMAKYVLNI